jgi:hypothetical protein
MKNWNKSKDVRQRCWHRVGPGPKVYDSSTFNQIKRWCWDHPSKGKFYFGPYTGWWFECEKDAAWFILKWGPSIGL